jgi:D-xylose transport system substrate-binding protein
MRIRRTAIAAAGLGLALTLAACGQNAAAPSAPASSAPAAAADAPKVGVILPETDSSARWEGFDKPLLTSAMQAEGLNADIQNAQGDEQKFATLADGMISSGVKVLVIASISSESGAAVAEKAKAQGIPVIAYDRPIQGADYYVSFDNFHVGELEGQMVVDGLKTSGKDAAAAQVVYVGGDPTDGNAKQFHDGADSVMSAAGIKPAFETQGTWDGAKAGTFFEQAYTALGGNIDAVWVANDTNAASVISVLDKNGKKVPVSGQDASPAALQNILLGKQAATVYKPFQLEAKAASDLAIQLLKGDKPSVDKKAADGTPFIAETPIVVNADNMQQVFDDGNAKVTDVCKGEVAAICTQKGIK